MTSKTNKAGMNATTGAAVVIEVVTEAAFVPSNANDIAAVVAGFNKRAKKEAKQFLEDVNAVALVVYPVIEEMVQSGIPYDKTIVTGAINEAAGFNTVPDHAKDDQGKEINARIKSFVSMRITRGVAAAMTAYVGRKQGYKLAEAADVGGKILEGALLAPNNLVKKTIVDRDDQGNVIDDKAPNMDTFPTLVPQNSVNSHLNTVLPGAVKARPGAVKPGGKSTDATDQMDTSIQMLMDTIQGKTTGKPAKELPHYMQIDRGSLRNMIDIVSTAKVLHNIALANGCDGATQYIMQCMDNSKDEAAVA